MATAELTIIALGRPDAGASRYLAEVQRRLARQRRVKWELHAMGTNLEGETADILAVVGELHAVPSGRAPPRASPVPKPGERRDKPQTLAGKVGSVRRLIEDDLG